MAIYLKNNKYQCPVSGLFHFYINLKPIKQEKSRSVNALCRAYSISTVTCDVKKFGIRGVNALCRAYSISTDFREQYQLFDKRCQCPVSGLFHFYGKDGRVGYAGDWMCQCPVSGLFHFYYNDG